LKIAILGTRGVPNYHGGFEQFAEYASVYFVSKGHEVVVYNSSTHPFKKNYFKGVEIVHCLDLEPKIGTAGQFIYDLNCILDARKQNFDIILQLGYTSSSIWSFLFPKKAIVVTNMDGLEWKRSKYSRPVQKFLKFAEKLAVRNSDYLVSDSIGIKKYLKEKYNADSIFIAYGAIIFDTPNDKILEEYNLVKYKYNMLIARIEPENNIETILDGVVLSKCEIPFLVIGKNNSNTFGKYLTQKYKNIKKIRFLGGIYNQYHLNNLRYYSNLYFHGHSVGGTNPSLLEAMASNALIIANDNLFNKSILKDNGLYFKTKADVKEAVDNITKEKNQNKLKINNNKIMNHFNYKKINNKYLSLFNKINLKN